MLSVNFACTAAGKSSVGLPGGKSVPAISGWLLANLMSGACGKPKWVSFTPTLDPIFDRRRRLYAKKKTFDLMSFP